MSGATATYRASLLDLSYAYASGIDRRNREVFLGAFHADAVLRAFEPGETEQPMMVRSGHAKLSAIVDRIVPSMCEKSFHLVANAVFEVDSDSDTASGEIYGVAHHFSPDHDRGGIDYVMYMRYLDKYTRVNGQWRISQRDALTDWAERRFIDPTSDPIGATTP